MYVGPGGASDQLLQWLASKGFPVWVDPRSGSVTLIGQALLGRIRFRYINAVNGNVGINVGGQTWAVPGSVTSQVPDWSTPWLCIGKGIAQSGAGAGTGIEWNSNSASEFALSSTTAWAGGFLYIARVGVHTHRATSRTFIGMKSTVTALSNADPSTQLDIVGFANDSADANFSFIQNDGSGTATKTSLGASFPAQTSQADYYEFAVFAAPGQTTSIDYYANNVLSGATTSGNVSSNLPTANTGLTARAWINNGTTAANVNLGMQSLYVQAQY